METLEHAIAFLKRLSQHALTIYGSRQGGSVAYGNVRSIANLILAIPPQEIERRTLLRRVKAFKDARKRAQLAPLNLLVDLGWLRRIAQDGWYLARS